jgi:hypothetical protein
MEAITQRSVRFFAAVVKNIELGNPPGGQSLKSLHQHVPLPTTLRFTILAKNSCL